MDWTTLAFIAVCLLQVLMFVVIKFNDLKHLSQSVKEIKTTLQSIAKDVVNVKERVSKIEGRLDIND